MRVAVIGCGPAGLAATHAAVGLGADVTVYAPKKVTPQRGPILMQRALPGINTNQPDGYIRQFVVGGSVLDYRLKLYGDVNIKINGDILEHGYPAWRVEETYSKLWNLYNDLIIDGEISLTDMYQIENRRGFDLVVNTAPAPSFCIEQQYGNKSHDFIFKEIAVTQVASYPHQPPNSIVFNAYPDIKWVRSSRVFDAEVTEWDIDNAPSGARIIRKPLSTNCDCHPRVFRTGRFGSWHNETWIDSAYFEVYRIITSMQNKVEWDAVK
jgi:hypothetical protein